MTRDEVLAEMEADFLIMTEEEKDMHLFTHEGRDWTPNLLIVEVRNGTPFGLQYTEQWSSNKKAKAQLDQLVAFLTGGGSPFPPGMEVIDLGTLGEEEDEDEDLLPEIPGLTNRGENKPS